MLEPFAWHKGVQPTTTNMLLRHLKCKQLVCYEGRHLPSANTLPHSSHTCMHNSCPVCDAVRVRTLQGPRERFEFIADMWAPVSNRAVTGMPQTYTASSKLHHNITLNRAFQASSSMQQYLPMMCSITHQIRASTNTMPTTFTQITTPQRLVWSQFLPRHTPRISQPVRFLAPPKMN